MIRSFALFMVLSPVLAIALLLGGCTTTPQGKSVDRSNYADLASTGLAYATTAGTEANPLGAALIPLKLGMGKFVENKYADNCIARTDFAKWTNSFYYGAAANNLAIVLGAYSPAAIPIGIAVGTAYYRNREKIEPGTFKCIPDQPAIEKYAEGYNTRNPELLASAFTEDAVTPWGTGHEEIKAAWENNVFSQFPSGWVKFRHWDGEQGEIWTWNDLPNGDHVSGPVQVAVTFDGELIDRMDWWVE